MGEHERRKKKILFVCIGNMCRSQMAEGFARSIAGDFVEPFSAGTHPTGTVSEEAIAVMMEKGIDISNQISKSLESVAIDEMDYVITMGCRTPDKVCPVTFAGEKIEWNVEDPIGEPTEVFYRVRDYIENRVKELLERIWKERKPIA